MSISQTRGVFRHPCHPTRTVLDFGLPTVGCWKRIVVHFTSNPNPLTLCELDIGTLAINVSKIFHSNIHVNRSSCPWNITLLFYYIVNAEHCVAVYCKLVSIIASYGDGVGVFRLKIVIWTATTKIQPEHGVMQTFAHLWAFVSCFHVEWFSCEQAI